MSINEYQEFEAINQKTSERNAQASAECHNTEDIHRAKRAKAREKALLCIAATLVALAAAVSGIIKLAEIGWINDIFCFVLMCLAGSVAMFKAGYFWCEFKQ